MFGGEFSCGTSGLSDYITDKNIIDACSKFIIYLFFYSACRNKYLVGCLRVSWRSSILTAVVPLLV